MTCHADNPATKVLIELEISNKRWTQLWTSQDGRQETATGAIAEVNESTIKVVDKISETYGRRVFETISRVTGAYYALVPSNSGNDLSFSGVCTPTDESIPKRRF
jgi:hypothetical protein